MSLDFLYLVFKDIWRRKFSSFLTLFAISLGILSIFVIVLLTIGFQDSIEKQFDQFGTNRLYVASTTTSLGSTSVTEGLDDSDVKFIEGRPYVKSVYPYYFRNAQVEFSNQFLTRTVVGTTFKTDFLRDVNLKIESGRFPKENEKFSMVVGPRVLDDIFDKDVQLGSNLYIKDTKFKVVGVFESIGNPQDDSQIYVNIDTIRDLFDDGDSIGVMDVVISEGVDILVAKENLQLSLDNRFGEDEVDVISPDQFLDQLNSILGIVNGTLGGIALVALIVGAFGIINTMYVIVTEKTKDIGIMKSIGATNEMILMMFSFQAGLFGFFGALLGLVLGSFAAIGFEAFAKSAGYEFLDITIDPFIFLSLLLFGFLVGVFSGILPAYQASKLNIVESMRK